MHRLILVSIILIYIFLFQPLRFDLFLLLITNLPVDSVKYTETDLANQLSIFGFTYEHDNIYVIPQTQMVRAGFNSAFRLSLENVFKCYLSGCSQVGLAGSSLHR